MPTNRPLSFEINTNYHLDTTEQWSQHNKPALDANDGGPDFYRGKNKDATAINGTIVTLGDSLSDSGNEHGKYHHKLFGYKVFRYAFNKRSPNDVFTDSFPWLYPLAERMKLETKEVHTSNTQHAEHFNTMGYAVDRSLAQGGATAHNYRYFSSKYVMPSIKAIGGKLSHLEKQSDKAKKKEGLKRDDLCIIFSGANDIFTVNRSGKKAAKQAVDAIQKAIANLSTGTEEIGLSNYSKNIVIFSLPDISVTPHYAKDPESKRKDIKETCQLINKHLTTLVNDYRYVNLDTYPIYQIDNINNKEAFFRKHNIKNGVLFTGKGTHRYVLFVENGEFISYPNGELRVADVILSEQLQKMLDSKEGKIPRPEQNFTQSETAQEYPMFEALIRQAASKAKLNADVRIFDAAGVFAKVMKNPQNYNITTGCAIYYTDQPNILEKIEGNAIVMKPLDDDTVAVSFFIDGKLITEKGEARSIHLALSTEEQEELKIRQGGRKGLVQLLSAEDTNRAWATEIIEESVKAYNAYFNEEIQLIPTKEVSWDNAHPKGQVHLRLEGELVNFLRDNYKIEPARQTRDLEGATPTTHSTMFFSRSYSSPDIRKDRPELLKNTGNTLAQAQEQSSPSITTRP